MWFTDSFGFYTFLYSLTSFVILVSCGTTTIPVCKGKTCNRNIFDISAENFRIGSSGDSESDDVYSSDVFENVDKSNPKVMKLSEVHDTGSNNALCWVEITTITEHKNGTKTGVREYAITFETPADIPEKYVTVPPKKEENETVEYTIFDKNTKKSEVVKFSTVKTGDDVVVRQNRRVICGSGPVYTKDYFQWPKSSHRKVEIRVSPKNSDRFEINNCDEPQSKVTIVRVVPHPTSTTTPFTKTPRATSTVVLSSRFKDSTEVSPTISTTTQTNDLDSTTITVTPTKYPTKKIPKLPITISSTTNTVTPKNIITTPPIIRLHNEDGITKKIPYLGKGGDEENQPECNINQKVVVKLKLSMDYYIDKKDGTGRESITYPFMGLERQAEFDVTDRDHVLPISDAELEEGWQKLADAGIRKYFVFNTNKNPGLFNFSDPSYSNLSQYRFDGNILSPQETVKRLDDIRNKISKCERNVQKKIVPASPKKSEWSLVNFVIPNEFDEGAQEVENTKLASSQHNFKPMTYEDLLRLFSHTVNENNNFNERYKPQMLPSYPQLDYDYVFPRRSTQLNKRVDDFGFNFENPSSREIDFNPASSEEQYYTNSYIPRTYPKNGNLNVESNGYNVKPSDNDSLEDLMDIFVSKDFRKFADKNAKNVAK